MNFLVIIVALFVGFVIGIEVESGQPDKDTSEISTEKSKTDKMWDRFNAPFTANHKTRFEKYIKSIADAVSQQNQVAFKEDVTRMEQWLISQGWQIGEVKGRDTWVKTKSRKKK